MLCDRQWARLQAVVALEPYRPALSVHTGEGGVRWQVDWRSALAAAAAAVGMTLIGTTFSPRVTATPPEEMAIAVSGVVRRLDIFLSFGVSGIGLSMMGSYRNGAFADVTLVTFALCAGASVVQIAIQRTSEQTWPGS